MLMYEIRSTPLGYIPLYLGWSVAIMGSADGFSNRSFDWYWSEISYSPVCIRTDYVQSIAS